MKKILASVLLVAAIGFTGCEEESTSPNTPAATNYFPMTQGSNWTYEVTIDFPLDTVVTETKTITGDTTVNGKKYVRVTSTDMESSSEFMRRSNDTVFTLGEDGNDEIMVIERKGATWTKTFEEEEGSATITYTVMDKGITRTVLGKTYNDVLYARGTGNIMIGNEELEVEFKGYMAKGIGPIEESSPLHSFKLKSYTIK